METQLKCPKCGGDNTVEGKSIFEGCIYIKNSFGKEAPHEVVHQCCTNCGTIVSSSIVKKSICSCGVCQG